jgi:hypothetical protein
MKKRAATTSTAKIIGFFYSFSRRDERNQITIDNLAAEGLTAG